MKQTDDWCLETTAEGIVQRCGIGGVDCYKDIGIFYWNKEDGSRLKKHVEQVCKQEEGCKRYWSNVPFVLYPDEYKVRINECQRDDVMEFDTIEELSKVDYSYKIYLER